VTLYLLFFFSFTFTIICGPQNGDLSTSAMSSINNVCDCGRKRGSMNEKNWSRHNEFCKIKKIKLSHNSNIKKFFCSVNSKCVSSEYLFYNIIIFYIVIAHFIKIIFFKDQEKITTHPVLPVHKDNAQNDDFNAIVNQNQGNFNLIISNNYFLIA